MRERVPLFAGLALLAVAVAVGAVVLADGIRDRNPSEGDVLTVTGSAKQRILSDYVVWNVALTSQQPTTAAAAEQLGSWADRLRAFLEGRGVRAEELTVQPISTESLTRRGNVYAYRLSRSFEVRSPRVKEIADTVERSSALLGQGIPLAGQPLQYVYTKLPSLRLQLLGEATKDAQNRAQVIAEATGAKLGGLRGVNVGVFQVTSPNSTEVDDYGFYDTSTLEKDVTAVVNVTFAVSS
jgi:uncharacterized protein